MIKRSQVGRWLLLICGNQLFLSYPGMYIVPYSPSPMEGGMIKGFWERVGKGRRKKEKKRKFGENINIGSIKLLNMIGKTQIITIWTLNTLFYYFMGKKIIDLVTRRGASLGRKSKAGGRNIQRLWKYIHPCENLKWGEKWSWGWCRINPTHLENGKRFKQIGSNNLKREYKRPIIKGNAPHLAILDITFVLDREKWDICRGMVAL